jgi:hypothetical protein
MKTFMTIVIFSSILYSCKPIYLYKYNSEVLGSEVSNLDSFFSEIDSNLLVDTLYYSYRFNKEFKKIKTILIQKNNLNINNDGNWYYAFIKGKDTLYCSKKYLGWRYKNYIGIYKSKEFNDSILD